MMGAVAGAYTSTSMIAEEMAREDITRDQGAVLHQLLIEALDTGAKVPQVRHALIQTMLGFGVLALRDLADATHRTFAEALHDLQHEVELMLVNNPEWDE